MRLLAGENDVRLGDQKRNVRVTEFAGFIAASAAADVQDRGAAKLAIWSMSAVGAVTEVVDDHTLGRHAATATELVDVLAKIHVAGYHAIVASLA